MNYFKKFYLDYDFEHIKFNNKILIFLISNIKLIISQL